MIDTIFCSKYRDLNRIAIIERGTEGTSVYLIRISYSENNHLDLASDNKCTIFSFPISFISCL